MRLIKQNTVSMVKPNSSSPRSSDPLVTSDNAIQQTWTVTNFIVYHQFLEFILRYPSFEKTKSFLEAEEMVYQVNGL